MFSVKLAFKLQQCHIGPTNLDPIWHKLWKCKIHERLKTLVWRIGSGASLTNLNFFSRLPKGDLGFPLCNSDVEFVSHLFLKCQATKMFWFRTCWGVRADLLLVNDDIDVVKLVVEPPIFLSAPSLLHQNLALASVQVALTLEVIWKFRNQHAHQVKIENPTVSIKALEH
jgi:hypothetical protein